MKTLARFASLAASALLFACPLAASAQSAAPAETLSTVSLSAVGEVKSAPDLATINLGVEAKAATAAQALAENAAAMSKVIAALKAQGVPAKAIQTSNISLNAQYTYVQNQPPQLTGYEASNDVTIRVDVLARLGATLDAVVGAGANQVSGISFGLKEPGSAEDAARLAAVKALRAKADLYAAATGYKIGRLLALNEGGGYATVYSPVPKARGLAMASAAPTPVAPGELTTRIDISGVYELVK